MKYFNPSNMGIGTYNFNYSEVIKLTLILRRFINFRKPLDAVSSLSSWYENWEEEEDDDWYSKLEIEKDLSLWGRRSDVVCVIFWCNLRFLYM